MLGSAKSLAQRQHSKQELKIKIQFLMAFRVIIVTTFLGSVILFRPPIGDVPFILPISFIIAITYVLTIIYAVMLPRVKRLERFCYIQILGDLLLETGVVYYTGGVDSFFTFLYILTIITTSMILYRRGSYIAASAASIFFGLVVNLEFHNLLVPKYYPTEFFITKDDAYVLYTLFLKIAAFYMVAFLSGSLAGKLKETGQELEERREDLIELRDFHENVVQSMQMGLLTTDLQYKVSSLNRYGQEILGIKRGEVIGKPCQEIFPPANFGELYRGYGYPSSHLHRFEGQFTRGDSKELHLGFIFSYLIDDESKVKGLIITFNDLTGIKAMEEKMKRSERLAFIGEIASGMAHEVRNPLASISGCIQMLNQAEREEGTKKRLMGIALKETERLDKIITDFLSYARPRPSQKELVDINVIIKETMELVKTRQDPGKQIEYQTWLYESPVLAMVDQQELKQVVWNLCVNSLESMEKGGKLRLSTHLKDGSDFFPSALAMSPGYNNRVDGGYARYAEIVVEDTGRGMRGEELSKIFNPFYTAKEGGTGLGLAIAYRIIEKHDGFIDVESAVNKGTRMHVYLPAWRQ